MSHKIIAVLKWMLRIVPAAVLLMTACSKLTANPQAIQLFTTLEMEPVGRIGIGIIEAVAGILILYPRTTGWGALLGLGTMAGAIFFHITKLGISMNGDTTLFTMAMIVFTTSLALVGIEYRKMISLV